MLKIADVFLNVTTEPVTADEDDTIEIIHGKMVQGSAASRCIYIVDKNKKILGKITLRDLLKIIAVREDIYTGKYSSAEKLFEYISKDLTAERIMTPPVFVSLENKIEEALQKMLIHNVEEIAVVDDEGRVVGDLNAYELINESLSIFDEAD